MKSKALKGPLGPVVLWLAGGALLLTVWLWSHPPATLERFIRQTNLTEQQAWVTATIFFESLKVSECVDGDRDGAHWAITNIADVFWKVRIHSNTSNPAYCESIGEMRIYVDDDTGAVLSYEIDHIERVDLRR
jgi:hypothetical protein